MPPKKTTPATKMATRTAQKPSSTGRTSASKAVPGSGGVKKGVVKPPVNKGGLAVKKTAVSPTKEKGKGKNEAEGKTKRAPSKEEQSAVIIQKYTRRHLARQKLEKLKAQKEQYEKDLERLQKEAWLKMVQMEREEAERERKKEEEERKRRKEEAKRRSRILEAAFDGDNEEILSVLEEALEQDSKKPGLSDAARETQLTRHQKALVECEDANKNTPLSEAGAGGQSETIRLLIEKGADVNTKGQYHRTPLWRAAFAGHLQAVQVLLEHGGDPRLVADDGTTPLQVAAIPSVEKVLQGWDISQTEALLIKIEADREKRLEIEKKLMLAETNRLEKEIEAAEKENTVCQKQLQKAYEELNKRIYEHDKCAHTDKSSITLQAVHDAEAVLELAKKKAETAKEKLAQAKLKLRDQKKKDEKEQVNASDLPGIKIMIKELDDVLFRDVGGKIAADGRWPLLIDPSSQSSLFLRYRDTNYLTALNPKHVEPEVIRMALLGAIRYGKPLVVDMMDVDMFDTLAIMFDEIQKGLMVSIMTKELLRNDKFLELLRPGDGEEYSKTAFLGARINNFMFVLITQMWNPPEKLVQQTYPIRVIIPSLPD